MAQLRPAYTQSSNSFTFPCDVPTRSRVPRLLQVSRPNCVSLCACHSIFLGGGLPCDLSFVMGPRKFVGFQFIQLFPCCKDGSDDTQDCDMMELKLEISQIPFKVTAPDSWSPPSHRGFWREASGRREGGYTEMSWEQELVTFLQHLQGEMKEEKVLEGEGISPNVRTWFSDKCLQKAAWTSSSLIFKKGVIMLSHHLEGCWVCHFYLRQKAISQKSHLMSGTGFKESKIVYLFISLS